MVLLDGCHDSGDRRTGIGLIFETGKALANFCRGVVKTCRQTGSLEGLSDLAHLANVSPHFGCRYRGGSHAFIFQRRLRDTPFFEQRLVYALMSRQRADGEDKSVGTFGRSEEHTSELQSRGHLVCRLL